MFSVLCNSNLIFPNNNRDLFKLNHFNGRRRYSSTQTTTSTLCFVSIRPRAISISSTDTTNDFTTTDSDYNKTLFTVSYLINSCGLSEEIAISISTKLRLKTYSQPDSVLTLLRNYGFANTHISEFVQRRPLLLLSDPIKTLKPKIEFFNSVGLCGTELAQVLSTNPTLLLQSLDNHIIPSIAFLRTILHTNTNLVKALKRFSWLINDDLEKQLAPKVVILQAHGVPISNISYLLTTRPRSLLHPNTERFDEVVKQVMEMGFDPLKMGYVHAVCVLTSMTKDVWAGKLDAYRSWGWSEEDICVAFMKQPRCMAFSAETIMQKMDFFVNKMGYDPSLIAQYSTVMTYSLERIIPRCSVLHVLRLNGLLKNDCSLMTALKNTEAYFLNYYVTKFEEQVPELLNVYLEKVNSLELPIRQKE